MSSGCYFPKAVKLVEIPKANGGTRPLGIPTIEDRIAPMAVVLAITPRIDPLFHEDSYGYRPNKSAHDAVAKAKERCIKLHQALKYMLNNRPELIGYVNVGNVFIDNNCCERAVRPFTSLRKNFGGFSSEDGGRVAAIYLSIVETCKLLKKPPLDFSSGSSTWLQKGDVIMSS